MMGIPSTQMDTYNYIARQVKDDWTLYLNQIQQAIRQLGGLGQPEKYARKTDEPQGIYIVNGEEPL